jgi:hypothetical protein
MECLDAIAERRLSAAQCLERYPQYSAHLEPLLTRAEALRAIRTIRPSLGFRKQASARLEQRIASSSRPPRAVIREAQPRGWFSLVMPRFALRGVVAALIVAVLASFTGIAAYASDGAAPGDPLYPLDTAVEEAQLRLAGDAEQALSLHIGIAEERLSEAEALLSEGDSEHLQTALSLYDEAVQDITAAADEAAAGDQKEAANLVSGALSVNQTRLQELLGRVPEQARPGIERALEASSRGLHNGAENGRRSQAFSGDQTTSPPGRGNHLGPNKDRANGNPHGNSGDRPDSHPGQGNGGGNSGGTSNQPGNRNGNGGGRPDNSPGQGGEHGNKNGNGQSENDNSDD